MKKYASLLLCFRYSSMGWLQVTSFGQHNGCGVRPVYVGQE